MSIEFAVGKFYSTRAGALALKDQKNQEVNRLSINNRPLGHVHHWKWGRSGHVITAPDPEQAAKIIGIYTEHFSIRKCLLVRRYFWPAQKIFRQFVMRSF